MKMKDVVFPSNTDVLYAGSISTDFEGIIIVFSNNDPIGYIVYESYENVWYFIDNICIDDCNECHDSLESLMVELLDSNINVKFKAIEFNV
jgi:hypothetical protein